MERQKTQDSQHNIIGEERSQRTEIIHIQLCLESVTLKIHLVRGFLSGPVIKHLPCDAGNVSSMLGWGTNEE